MSELVFDKDGRQVWLESLEPPYRLSLPFPMGPYVCLLWANVPNVPADQRRRLCTELIASGCRYLVCGGHECEAWHDTADDAYLAVDPSGVSPDVHVMTTWHEGEPLKDVVFFFLNCADDGLSHRRHLILQIGHDPRHAKTVSELVTKHRFNDELPNYSINPAAGGTAPAESPRRALARRGLC